MYSSSVYIAVLCMMTMCFVSILDPAVFGFYWSLGIYMPSAVVYAVTAEAWRRRSARMLRAAAAALAFIMLGFVVFLAGGFKSWSPVHVGVVIILLPTSWLLYATHRVTCGEINVLPAS
jgi:hypothetical protein